MRDEQRYRHCGRGDRARCRARRRRSTGHRHPPSAAPRPASLAPADADGARPHRRPTRPRRATGPPGEAARAPRPRQRLDEASRAAERSGAAAEIRRRGGSSAAPGRRPRRSRRLAAEVEDRSPGRQGRGQPAAGRPAAPGGPAGRAGAPDGRRAAASWSSGPPPWTSAGQELDAQRAELARLDDERREVLERAAGLTADQAEGGTGRRASRTRPSARRRCIVREIENQARQRRREPGPQDRDAGHPAGRQRADHRVRRVACCTCPATR